MNNRLFEYNFLPFGLENAPAHFARVMMSVLASMLGHGVFVYLDNIIVIGATVEENMASLLEVLEVLKHHGMKVNLDKCQFFQTEVEFPGHIITSEGLKPCADKVVAIKEFPQPKHAKDVASFLGLAGYYHKFIRNFGQIARPLNSFSSASLHILNSDKSNLLYGLQLHKPTLSVAHANPLHRNGHLWAKDSDCRRPARHCQKGEDVEACRRRADGSHIQTVSVMAHRSHSMAALPRGTGV